MSILKFGSSEMPSVISDPFQKGKIESVAVHITKGLTDEFYFWGRVEFKNGNTRGEQRFEGDSFDDVVLKIKAMIENL